MKPTKLHLTILLSLLLTCSQAQEAQLVIPMGHAQRVNHISVSHDFKLIASVDDSDIIHIWDTRTNREMMQLTQHAEGLVNVDFHPSRLELVSSDKEGTIFIWDVTKGTFLKEISSKDSEPLIKYLPSGDQFVSAGNALTIYDSKSGKSLVTKKASERITALAYAPAYKYIVVGTAKGSFIAYDPATLEEKYRVNETNAAVTALGVFDETRDRVYVGYDDGYVSAINITNDKVAQHQKIMGKQVLNILPNSENGVLAIVGIDGDEDVKFYQSNLEPDNASRFKWSSKPLGNLGLKGIAWADNQFDKIYLADHGNSIRIWSVKNKELLPENLKGTARSIYDIDTDGAGESLVIGSRHGQIKVVDLTGAHQLQLLEGNRGGGIVQLDYNPDQPYVLGVGRETEEISIWKEDKSEALETLKREGYLRFNMAFTTGTSFIRKVSPNRFENYDFLTKQKKELEIPNVVDLKISPDGSFIAFKTVNEIILYHSYDLKPVLTIKAPYSTDFTFAGDKVLSIAGSTVSTFQETTKLGEVNTMKVKDKIVGLSNGEYLLYSSQSSRSHEYNAYHFSADGKLISALEGHHHYITKIIEVQERVLTASLDGTIKIWQKDKGKFKEIGSIIPLRREDYVVITPDDLFDATPNAMQEMHFTIGGEIIALEQLKDTYYEPNLLPKLLGYGGGELRKPVDISELGLAPEIVISQHPNVGNGVLKLKVTSKGGGIGRVSLTINGKEASGDLRKVRDGSVQTMELEYDVKGHPFLFGHKPNKLSLKVYNKEGTLGSEPKNIYVLPTGDEEAQQPKIFSIVIGTSDYADDEMDLKYAAKDAEDFASALQMSSSNLIGGENIVLSVLTTNQSKDKWPTKANIKKVFEQYAHEAKARDYLIVYMAGHGVNSGGDDGDFYYLTCTATDGRVFNEDVRKNHAISSAEFTEYIKSVPALNQVMIVDACHSGTLTSSFGKSEPSKSMDSEEVKAYERMKDRTGIFLLAGSAADAVSYETTLYGQGLLTYALLFGMKGAALHEGEFIDVLDLFQFAAKKVPQLAEDIGGIQRPEVRVPTEAESFNIGRMTDSDKARIQLLQPKPVFVHSTFQDDRLYQDVLKIGKSLDTKLAKVARTDNAPIIFMNENYFSGALHVTGRYEQKGQLTIVKVKVFEDDRERMEFHVEGVNASSISDNILHKLLELIESS